MAQWTQSNTARWGPAKGTYDNVNRSFSSISDPINQQYEWNKQGFSRVRQGATGFGSGEWKRNRGGGGMGGGMGGATGPRRAPMLGAQQTPNIKITPRDRVLWSKEQIGDQVANSVGSLSQMLGTGPNSPLGKRNVSPGISYGQRNKHAVAFQMAPILASIADAKYRIPMQRGIENLAFRTQQEAAMGSEANQLYDAWRRGQHAQNQYQIGQAQNFINALG